jgi:N-acetylglucosamine-6-sulfatase
MHNIYPNNEAAVFVLGHTERHVAVTTKASHVVARLDALLVVLKTCKARACTHPYEVLHPGRDVYSLRDALAPLFDDFYASQDKLVWKQCEQAYIAESEGPDSVNQYMWHEISV